MASNDNQPMDKLKDVGQDVLKALGERAMSKATGSVGGLTDKFEDIAGGGPIGKAVKKGGDALSGGGGDDDSDDDSDDDGKSGGVMGALKGAASTVKDKITGGGGSKSPKATKAMNIIESIDVGVPITVAYNQWTQWDEFPSFMKKVENADALDDEDTKTSWKAQVFWSHRTWEATVIEQSPDERIVWRSTGAKGHVDGAVTFHELGPTLTRILVVLEYYPQGFMERTGNIWRAAGRRARLELKHFRRHVMTRTILNPDEVEGWRGVIEDGEVVKTHDEAVEEEQQQQEEQDDQSDEYDESEDEFEDEESDEDEESEDEESEDEDESDEEEEDEPDEEEEDEPEEEPAPRRRRAKAS